MVAACYRIYTNVDTADSGTTGATTIVCWIISFYKLSCLTRVVTLREDQKK